MYFLFILKFVYYSLLCFIVLCLSLIYILGEVPSFRRYRLSQKLPGPKGYFLIGNSIELFSTSYEDLIPWITSYFEKYDRLFRTWILGYCAVFMIKPEDLQVILSNSDYNNKGLEYFSIKAWLDEGLLTSNGEKWHSRRKIITPAFHFKILEDYLITFNKSSKLLCEKLTKSINKEIELDNLSCNFALDVITKTAMGVDLGIQTDEENKYVITTKLVSKLLMKRVTSAHLMTEFLFNLSKTGKIFYNAVKYLQGVSSKVIEERKSKINIANEENVVSATGRVKKAFLDLMIDYENKNAGSLTDKGIREEVDTFMFEGHDTTSATFNFTMFTLAKYPEIQEKVYKEIKEIFGEDIERDVTPNDLKRMSYLEKVIKETLRLYPTVPAVSRLLEKDVVLNDGLLIPAWTNITIPILLVQRNPKYWPNPEVFDPERFTEENIKGRHPYSYIPFSAGPRNCIGQKFAMMEIKTVVANVVRRLKILPVTKLEDIKFVSYIILRTLKPIKYKFVLREN